MKNYQAIDTDYIEGKNISSVVPENLTEKSKENVMETGFYMD